MYSLSGSVVSAVSVGSVLEHVFGYFNDIEMIFIILSSMFTAGSENRKLQRSDITTAAKILSWRTSYPNVLWGVSGVLYESL